MLTSKQKTEWVAALRSGEFEQGKWWLEFEGKFCCLGVLAKINGLSIDGKCLNHHDHSSINLCIIDVEGIVSPCGSFHECGMQQDVLGKQSLGDMNDSGKYSFAQIADHIEQHLPTKD